MAEAKGFDFSNDAIDAARQERGKTGVAKKRSTVKFKDQQIRGSIPLGIQTITDNRAPVKAGTLSNPKPDLETKKTSFLGLSFDKEPIKILSEIGTAIINMKKTAVNLPLYNSNIATVENNARIKLEFLQMHKEARLKALGRRTAFERGQVKVQTAAKGITASEGSYGAIEADIIQQADNVRKSIEIGVMQQRMGIISKAEQEKNKQLYSRGLEFAEARNKLTRSLFKTFVSRIHYDEKVTSELTDESKKKKKEFDELADFNKFALERRTLMQNKSAPHQVEDESEPDLEIGEYGEDFQFGDDKGEGVLNWPGEDYKWVEDEYGVKEVDTLSSDPKIQKAKEQTLKKLEKPLSVDDLIRESLFDHYDEVPKYIRSPVKESKNLKEAATQLTEQIFSKSPMFVRSNYIEAKGKKPPDSMKYPIIVESSKKKFFVDQDIYDKNYDRVVEAFRVNFQQGMSIEEFSDFASKTIDKRYKGYKLLDKNRIKQWCIEDVEKNPAIYYPFPEDLIK